ncbi:MAG: hypothetical protein J3R72DRAFT_433250, partial [Linnemannia gamsii]
MTPLSVHFVLACQGSILLLLMWLTKIIRKKKSKMEKRGTLARQADPRRAHIEKDKNKWHVYPCLFLFALFTLDFSWLKHRLPRLASSSLLSLAFFRSPCGTEIKLYILLILLAFQSPLFFPFSALSKESGCGVAKG